MTGQSTSIEYNAHLWATYEFHMSNLMKFAITSLESYITEPLNLTINIDFHIDSFTPNYKHLINGYPTQSCIFDILFL